MPRIGSLTMGVALIAGVFAAGQAGDAAAAKKTVYLKEMPPEDAELGFQGMSRGELLGTIKRVGLMRVELPAEMSERADAQRAIRGELVRYLTAAGLEIVLADDHDKRLTQLEHDAGGFYDSTSGKLRLPVKRMAESRAAREFVESEKLDGLVVPSVVSSTADLSGRDSKWDNVADRSAGPEDAALAGGWGGWKGGVSQGSLRALSLQLRVVMTDGRTVFDRRGGIQLSSYVTRTGGAPSFSIVPLNDLLLDPARIARAVRVVTMPLRHSPVEIARGGSDPDIDATEIDLQTLPVPPPGAVPHVDPSSPLLVPREEILKSVKRVALSGLASDDINVPGWLDGRMGPHIKSELAKLGWEVVDAPDARELFAARLAAANPFDPFTGKSDEARIREVSKAAMHELSLDPSPDAMLWVSFEQREAVHHDGIAEWDGVAQNGFTLGPEKTSAWSVFARPNDDRTTFAAIPALSLVVSLTDANGRVLYRSAGGVHLLQRLRSRGSWMERTPLSSDWVFRRPARDPVAVHAALRDLVLSPQELSAERIRSASDGQ